MTDIPTFDSPFTKKACVAMFENLGALYLPEDCGQYNELRAVVAKEQQRRSLSSLGIMGGSPCMLAGSSAVSGKSLQSETN